LYYYYLLLIYIFLLRLLLILINILIFLHEMFILFLKIFMTKRLIKLSLIVIKKLFITKIWAFNLYFFLVYFYLQWINILDDIIPLAILLIIFYTFWRTFLMLVYVHFVKVGLFIFIQNLKRFVEFNLDWGRPFFNLAVYVWYIRLLLAYNFQYYVLLIFITMIIFDLVLYLIILNLITLQWKRIILIR